MSASLRMPAAEGPPGLRLDSGGRGLSIPPEGPPGPSGCRGGTGLKGTGTRGDTGEGPEPCGAPPGTGLAPPGTGRPPPSMRMRDPPAGAGPTGPRWPPGPIGGRGPEPNSGMRPPGAKGRTGPEGRMLGRLPGMGRATPGIGAGGLAAAGGSTFTGAWGSADFGAGRSKGAGAVSVS